MNSRLRSTSLVILAAGCLASRWASAQGPIDQLPPDMILVKHRMGDSVQPTYEGWNRMPDGTISHVVRLLQPQHGGTCECPAGERSNKFDLPMADQGQPAYFYPGYHQFVFQLDLPKDWPADKKAVWTLVTQ